MHGIMTGRFIVVEGNDGSGKTTLIQSLAQALSTDTQEVVTLREPGGTELGEVLRQLLKGEIAVGDIDNRAEALLFQAARAQLCSHVILPALQRGAYVICDRFDLSTRVYQGIGRGLGIEPIEQLTTFATNGVTPDITLYLALAPEIAETRREVRDPSAVATDRFEQSASSFFDLIHQGYDQLASLDRNTRVIDAAQSPQSVCEQALQYIHALN